MTIIHYVGYASQPDIQIKCDESWTTPAWGAADWSESDVEIPTEVYKTTDKRYYTFTENKVTCEKCLIHVQKKEIEELKQSLENADDLLTQLRPFIDAEKIIREQPQLMKRVDLWHKIHLAKIMFKP